MSLPDEAQGPNALVELGRIASAYGVSGWIKLHTHTPHPPALLGSSLWWLAPLRAPDSAASHPDAARPVRVLASRPHGATVVAHLEGVEDRDQADALKGRRVLVRRADFPEPESGEIYWVDLIGCRVYGEHEGEPVLLGTVHEVMDNGVHGVLRVLRQSEGDDGVLQPQHDAKGRPVEVLVPFVEAHVHTVDLAGKRLDSNWPIDF